MTSPLINPRLAFLIEHLDLPSATGIPDATWETFQLSFLNSDRLLDITTKSRQIGFSWIAAADSVAGSILVPNSPHVFVSINQDEAREKIRYARQIISSLDKSVRPTSFIIENQTELELANGSRMISGPCRPPRGKGRLAIYLDEFAHYPIAGEIYKAAIPVTTRGGRVRIGSSPLGAQGMFWEIFAEKFRAYPGFHRRFLPWWVARGLCNNTITAREEAPHMETYERVEKFGSKRLIEIFENMPLEDFQQEYECAWVDESESWITWAEIQRNQTRAQNENLKYKRLTFTNTDDLLELRIALEELKDWQQHGKIEPFIGVGVDVGRKKNKTEIIGVGHSPDHNLTPYRLGITLDRCEFAVQEHAIGMINDYLSVTSCRIDSTGLGMQLGENMVKKYPEICSEAHFTVPNKRIWATQLKLGFQREQTPIPLDKGLSYQIHSVKKTVTGSNVLTFTAANTKEHHADEFWALALSRDGILDESGTTSEYGDMPM